MYQKKTLRKMSPEQKRLALVVNDLEKQIRTLKKMVETTGSLEFDSKALRSARQLNDSTRKKNPKEDYPLEDWEKDSVKAQSIKVLEKHNR